jgi:tetratricopeptide (TPR) repeat protein
LWQTGRWTDGGRSAGFLILSLLSKVNTVVAPAVFLLYACKEGAAPWSRSCRASKTRLGSLALLCLIAAAFIAVHYFVSYGASRLAPGRLADAAITGIRLLPADEFTGYFGGFTVHLLNFPAFLLFYIRMIFFPAPLSAWQMFPIHSGLDGSLAAAWIALFGLAWIVYRSPRGVQFWMLWFFLFLSPVLQLIPNGIWVADRYLYVPAIGAFVLVSKLFFYVLDRLGALWLRLSWEAIMLVVLFAFAWQTHRHLPVWRNDLTLWEATTRTCMTSAYCHYRLGTALLGTPSGNPPGDPLAPQVQPAVRELAEAARLRPVPVYWIALADSLSDYAGDYPRAFEAYRMARESGRPLSVTFLARVAKAYYLSGDLEQARLVIADGQRIQPDNSEMLFVQAFVEWKLGNFDAAQAALRKGLELNAVNPLAAHPARFLNDHWKHPADVGGLLSDLSPL